jgi:hypothetical protein
MHIVGAEKVSEECPWCNVNLNWLLEVYDEESGTWIAVEASESLEACTRRRALYPGQRTRCRPVSGEAAEPGG